MRRLQKFLITHDPKSTLDVWLLSVGTLKTNRLGTDSGLKACRRTSESALLGKSKSAYEGASVLDVTSATRPSMESERTPAAALAETCERKAERIVPESPSCSLAG